MNWATPYTSKVLRAFPDNGETVYTEIVYNHLLNHILNIKHKPYNPEDDTGLKLDNFGHTNGFLDKTAVITYKIIDKFTFIELKINTVTL